MQGWEVKDKTANNIIARIWLEETFPSLFKTYVPLKVGIHKDIIPLVPDRVKRIAVRRVIYQHVIKNKYKATLIKGNPRFGIEGECGVVDSE